MNIKYIHRLSCHIALTTNIKLAQVRTIRSFEKQLVITKALRGNKTALALNTFHIHVPLKTIPYIHNPTFTQHKRNS